VFQSVCVPVCSCYVFAPVFQSAFLFIVQKELEYYYPSKMKFISSGATFSSAFAGQLIISGKENIDNLSTYPKQNSCTFISSFSWYDPQSILQFHYNKRPKCEIN
jgi:hypothetical protein